MIDNLTITILYTNSAKYFPQSISMVKMAGILRVSGVWGGGGGYSGGKGT